MTTGNAPAIEEQIAHERDAFELHAQIHGEADPMMAAKIASLEKLAAIESQMVPVEPSRFYIDDGIFVLAGDYDALKSALQVAQEERDRHMGAVQAYIEDIAVAMEKMREALAKLEEA